MDFARKQLEKYGWTDGKGLGKNENGISEALKPKLKRSVAGIGHDAAADFTEHWWTQLYDKAAKNVEVEEKYGKTKKIKTKDNNEFEITNSVWKINKKHKKNKDDEQYVDFFIKKAVLTNGGSKIEKTAESESDDEVSTKKDVFKMTDEELFAACEGRTAHKGARHGLKATGKLARIAQQEQTLLTKPKYSGYSHTKNISKDLSEKDLQVVEHMSLSSDGDVKLKKKKKKKKRCFSHRDELEAAQTVEACPVDIQNDIILENVANSDNEQKNSRKSKSLDEDLGKKSSIKMKKKLLDPTEIINEQVSGNTEGGPIKKRKMKMKL